MSKWHVFSPSESETKPVKPTWNSTSSYLESPVIRTRSNDCWKWHRGCRLFVPRVSSSLVKLIQVQPGASAHSSVLCPGRGTCGCTSSSDDNPPLVFSTGALLLFFLFIFFSFFFLAAFSPSDPLSPLSSSPSSVLPFPFFPPFFFFFFFLSSAMAAWSPFFFLWSQFSSRQAKVGEQAV